MFILIYSFKTRNNLRNKFFIFSRKLIAREIFSEASTKRFPRKSSHETRSRSSALISTRRWTSVIRISLMFFSSTQWRTQTKLYARKKNIFSAKKFCFHRDMFYCRFFSLAQLADENESLVFAFERRRSTLSVRISPASSLADEMQTVL